MDTTQATVGVASAPAGGAPQYEPPNLFAMFTLFPIIMFIFYIFVAKPQQSKEKKRKEIVSSLKKGEKILTTGGLYGHIVDIKDNYVVLKIAKEIKVEIAKDAVIPLDSTEK